MPKLGDYLGHILSEITIARMHADVEAIRVAELYADHPLLRHMPVPRFRMPNLEIDVPVVINKVDQSDEDDSQHGTPKIAEMRKAFDKVLLSVMTKEKVQLTQVLTNKLKNAVDRKMISLTRPNEIALDLNRVSIEFTNTALKVLGGAIDPEKKMIFSEKLKDSLRVEFVKLRKKPSRLDVLVTTSEIREAGPSEVITHLHLKISEEGYEWSSIETEDGKEDRLVIE